MASDVTGQHVSAFDMGNDKKNGEAIDGKAWQSHASHLISNWSVSICEHLQASAAEETLGTAWSFELAGSNSSVH